MKGLKDTKFFCLGLTGIGVGLVLLCSSACRSSISGQESQRDEEARARMAETAPRDLFDTVNGARAREGMHRLKWSEDLAAVARSHARKMAARKRLSHSGFQGRFAELSQRGVVGRLTENVAMGKGHANPALTTLSGWIDSPGHRRNLYDETVTLTGIGFAMADDGAFYYVQLYGR